MIRRIVRIIFDVLSSVSDSLADINHILRANHVWTPFTLLWNESVSRLLLSWSRWPFKNVDDQICGSFLLLSLLIITVALLLLFDEFLCICHAHMLCCHIFCLLLDFLPDIGNSNVTCYCQYCLGMYLCMRDLIMPNNPK